MDIIKIAKGIFIHDLCLYIREHNFAVIGDTHIGYEEALNKQGILIPRFQFREIMLRLEGDLKGIMKEFGVKMFLGIIINGDIKHEFGRISEQEWRHTLRLLDFLAGYSKKLVLVKGNHDTILGPIADKRNVEVVSHMLLGDVLLAHGDKLPSKETLKGARTVIIGHEHPAVGVNDGIRTEVFKCFLKGRWKRKELIVMPSFNLVNEGSDVLKEKTHSPFLREGVGDFEAFIVAEKVYSGVKVKSLQ